MNKLIIFWFKNRQDILVALFCLLLVFFASRNLHATNRQDTSDIVWVGWMALVIGASMVLGVAVNKISVREQKIATSADIGAPKSTKNTSKKLVKKIGFGLLIIFSFLFIFSFVKYRAIYLPFGWAQNTAISVCMCANCTAEQCRGSELLGKPFLEHYIEGDTENNNKLAVNLNLYIIHYLMFTFVAVGACGLVFWIVKKEHG